MPATRQSADSAINTGARQKRKAPEYSVPGSRLTTGYKPGIAARRAGYTVEVDDRQI